MTVIKLMTGAAGTRAIERESCSGECHETKEEDGAQPSTSGEAVKFRRQDTNLHRAYTRAAVDDVAGRAARLADLKERVRNGTYRPNLTVVAERILADMKKGGV